MEWTKNPTNEEEEQVGMIRGMQIIFPNLQNDPALVEAVRQFLRRHVQHMNVTEISCFDESGGFLVGFTCPDHPYEFFLGDGDLYDHLARVHEEFELEVDHPLACKAQLEFFVDFDGRYAASIDPDESCSVVYYEI